MLCIPFEIAQSQILRILTGTMVVGHAAYNNVKVTYQRHLPNGPLSQKTNCLENSAMSLKNFIKKLLDQDIQARKSGCSLWKMSRPP
jgi:interferon-stimulated exonuclease-like 2